LRRLSVLLDTALELPESEHTTWLAGLDGDDVALGPTLRELLARRVSKETADLLHAPPAFTIAGAPANASELHIGDTVGPYRLERVLGRGGMGEVWLAERVDGSLKRKVALKLPHVTWAPGLAERFAREREILSGLEHPNIARLYDAGVDAQGRPYMALEYVEGQPLDEFCKAGVLSIEARLKLLLQVADAIAFAHSRLVLHRDLKPGNMLVTADGKLRLLDFGIAKLMEGDATRETVLTQVSGRALTLDYASPEQIRGEPIGTASDVYSLGVVAFELLAGARPYRLKRGSAAELEEAITGADTPLASEMADGLAVRKLLKGDLDATLNKALKKHVVERYPTIDTLAQDWRHHLAGRGVTARPDTLSYRLTRFARRHRVPLGAGAVTVAAFGLALGFGATALVILALLIGLGAALSQAKIARAHAKDAHHQAELAKQETHRAQVVQGFLTELFEANSTMQADPQAAQRTTARELLDRGASRVDDALHDAPQSRIEVMGTLANIYDQLGLGEQATELQSRRVALARQNYGARDARMAGVLLDYVFILQEGARRQEIPALLQEAIAALDAAGDPQSETRGAALREASNYWRYVSLREFLRSADEAAEFLERYFPALDITPGAHMLAARAQLAAFAFEAAEVRAQAGIEAAKRQGTAAAFLSLHSVATLASALEQQMKYEQADARYRHAIELCRRQYGEDHPEALISAAQYGNFLLSTGRTVEGDALHEVVRSRLAREDVRLDAQYRTNLAGLLGRTLLARGRPRDAAPLLLADVEDMRKTLPNSGALAVRELQLADVQAALGDVAGAQITMDQADHHWRAFADGEPTPLVDTSFAIGRARILMAAGDAAAALVLLDPARPAIPLDRLRLAIEQARAELASGNSDRSLSAVEAVLQHVQALPEGWRPVQLEASALQTRGEARLSLGDLTGAKSDLSAALAIRRAHDAPDSLWCAQLDRALAALGGEQVGPGEAVQPTQVPMRTLHAKTPSRP
ncbi:MAG: protein kinase, partial [Betaproteobacteria bacterium]